MKKRSKSMSGRAIGKVVAEQCSRDVVYGVSSPRFPKQLLGVPG
jgi:hypothetical protein